MARHRGRLGRFAASMLKRTARTHKEVDVNEVFTALSEPGSPSHDDVEVSLVVRSLSGRVLATVAARASEPMRVVKQRVAEETSSDCFFQLVTAAGKHLKASSVLGDALDGAACFEPSEVELTLVVTQDGWDRSRSGGLVSISPCGGVATSAHYSSSFLTPGMEAVGCSVLDQPIFSISLRLVSLRDNWITRVGLVMAAAEGCQTCLMNQSYVYCSGAEAYRGDWREMSCYGLPFGAGDRITVSYANGTVRFLLNGEDQGVAFQNVPLPLRPYAFCDSHAAWELGE